MKTFYFLVLLILTSFCTSKPNKTEECFIQLQLIGPVDEYEPPLIISNFYIPDSIMRSNLFQKIQLSKVEYERVRKIIKSRSSIQPDTSSNTNLRYGSIEVSENCNDKIIFSSAFDSPKSEKYLAFVIQLMKDDNTNQKVIKSVEYKRKAH